MVTIQLLTALTLILMTTVFGQIDSRYDVGLGNYGGYIPGGFQQGQTMMGQYPQQQMKGNYVQQPIAAGGFNFGYQCGKCSMHMDRCRHACTPGLLDYKCAMCFGVPFDTCHQCMSAGMTPTPIL